MMILKSRINESNTETSNDVTEPPKRARLLRDAVEYTELENVTESHASNLTISNSEQYSHGPTALETNDKEETKLGDRQHAVERFRHSFSQWSSDLCHVMTSEDACRALGDLSPGGVLLPVQHATGTCCKCK
jgi:hypothetical protein